MSQPPVAIVVGASSGIGEALARNLAREGRRVAVLARRQEPLEALARALDEAAEVARGQASDAPRARAYVHDAADHAAVEPLFARIEDEMGPVSELYYVAGVMPDVELAEFDTAKDALQFAVNTVGSIAWCNAAASRFLHRKAGTIVGVTSVAGDRGRVARPGYCASKAGQDAHLEGLRNRLWRHGVQVTTVRPGFVDTPMTQGVEGMFWVVSADWAARTILKAVARRRAVVYVPARWRLVMTIIKSIPSFVFRKLNV